VQSITAFAADVNVVGWLDRVGRYTAVFKSSTAAAVVPMSELVALL